MTSIAESLILYTRRNCHLCEDARSVLVEGGYMFREVDIAGDPGLEAEFATMVPVVQFNGEVIFSAGMAASQLPELLAELSAR